MSKGKNSEALEFYEKAITQDSNSIDIWLEYTTCLRKNHKFQRAVQAGWHVLELNPQHKDIWTNIGNTYLDCLYWKQAYESFLQYETKSKDTLKAIQNFLNLGYYQMIFKDYNGAENTFKHALQLKRDHGLTMIDIGQLHIVRGDLKTGKKEIEEGISIMKKTRNKNGIEYGKSILNEVQTKGKLVYDIPIGSSYQVLPERLLVRGSIPTINLKIDSLVERYIQFTPTGRLSFLTPEIWNEIIDKQEDLVFIRFQSDSTDNFSFIITPYTKLFARVKSEDLNSLTKESGDKTLLNSIEKNYQISKFNDGSNLGTFYTLTDKSYKGKVDDFKYHTAGFMITDYLPIAFTLLTNNNDSEYLSTFIEVLKSLKIK